MQDLAALLSDVVSYMSAGRRSRSRGMRWLVRCVMVALAVALVWVMWRM
ncbi:hypothetical protein QUB40_29540 [Microcoleus sp. AT9_A2]